MVKSGDLKAYFDRARLWEQDLLSSAQRSKRLAWTVAAVSPGRLNPDRRAKRSDRLRHRPTRTGFWLQPNRLTSSRCVGRVA